LPRSAGCKYQSYLFENKSANRFFCRFFICQSGFAHYFLTNKMVSVKPVETDSAQRAAAGVCSAISEKKLEQLDRLANLGTLSAGIAHEIKNGLVPIKTFVELMLQRSEDRELAATVERELKRIDSLISQTLRLAAPRPTAFAPVPVHDILEISLRLLQHQISDKMITVIREFHARPGLVHGDEAQLQQVVMNLLLNALEAMGPNGTLTISTKGAGDEHGSLLKINIQDTGIGIPRENLERVFEPFFTTKKSGTGLGLAISQRVVQEHHGEIKAHSEAGKGSIFTVSLPITK
jgi:signal transduction histidine kinase